MENISFIIPLNTFDNEVEVYLEKCLNSIKENRNVKASYVIFVGPTEIINKASVVYNSLKMKCTLTLIDNNETDFETQINKAVMQCTTKYFIVVEFDDTLYPYICNESFNYLKYNNSSVLMSINETYDTKNKFTGFLNEIALSNSFTNEQGLIDIECLETFMDFNVTGALIKTEDFISIGGLKPSLKIASWYEFLLRMCYNGYTVRVLPKIGYKHTTGRENSYMETIPKTISQDEIKWLINTAKEEYFFKDDRNKKFDNA